jgi:transcriptional regulator GlxA family with amidase domain
MVGVSRVGRGNSRRETKGLSFGFILAPKFTLTAFSGFVDMLRLCADKGDRSRQIDCNWTIVSSSSTPISASCGVEVRPWETFGDPGRFDYIVVVGGQLSGQVDLDREMLEFLRRADCAGVPLIGLCTGSFILASAGLMERRRCCVHWYHEKDFGIRHPSATVVSDRLFVDDGDRLTCAGGTAVVDLAAHIFARYWDNVRSMKASRHMTVDWPRDSGHSQMSFVNEQYDISDRRLQEALKIMEENLSTVLPIQDLAKRCNVSVRQLDRQFRSVLGQSPSAFHRDLRLRHATWLLNHTNRSVTEIAFECGFADSSHLSRIFRQAYGTSPALVRNSIAAKQKVEVTVTL